MDVLAKGEILAHYEILEPIGEGGMGRVYKAVDRRPNRTVAIKIAKSNFSDRFQREAEAIAKLKHPHICVLYDVGPNYLVMEYLEGRDACSIDLRKTAEHVWYPGFTRCIRCIFPITTPLHSRRRRAVY